MPKSKNSQKTQKKPKLSKEEKIKARRRKAFWRAFYDKRQEVWDDRLQHVRLHRSFKRSYREDYKRPIKLPGMIQEAGVAMRVIVKNWRIFLPLLLLVVITNTFFVGIMSESSYSRYRETLNESYQQAKEHSLGQFALAGITLVSTVTTGGLSTDLGDVQKVIAAVLIAVVWLCTIYALRQLLAGNKPTFRETIYNACGPLFSTLVAIGIIILHALPLFIFTIFYSSAKSTDFLSHPLYAFIFWVFGLFLIIFSLYLLAGSVLGLVAVTVPGIYPIPAVRAANDLVQGRRIKVIVRILFSIVYIAVWWAIILWPASWLDILLKNHISWLENVPIIPFLEISMTTFTVIFFSTYIYLFYRRMLDND